MRQRVTSTSSSARRQLIGPDLQNNGLASKRRPGAAALRNDQGPRRLPLVVTGPQSPALEHHGSHFPRRLRAARHGPPQKAWSLQVGGLPSRHGSLSRQGQEEAREGGGRAPQGADQDGQGTGSGCAPGSDRRGTAQPGPARMGPGHRRGDRQSSRGPPQQGMRTGLPSPPGRAAGAHANQVCAGTRVRLCLRRPHSRCSGERRVMAWLRDDDRRPRRRHHGHPPAAARRRQLRQKIVTVLVEDTHFRVTCDGAEISLHPRAEQRPVTRWKAKIHGQRPERASSNS